jgi:hypothetical protein
MAYVVAPNPKQPLDPSAETAAGQRQRGRHEEVDVELIRVCALRATR